jgi:DNA-binding HxlR family transcriptional regulator
MAKLPIPGQPVRGSKSGLPLMALFDLMGRSWALGALWQLCESGPATFRALQERCEGVSPAVLNARLKELRSTRLVEKTSRGYAATVLGMELYEQLRPMHGWSYRWAKAFEG